MRKSPSKRSPTTRSSVERVKRVAVGIVDQAGLVADTMTTAVTEFVTEKF